MDSKGIFNICIQELTKYFPKFNNVEVKSFKVIKEKKATFKSTPKSDKARNEVKSALKNLLFVGDWTNTKLPGTIEGAILSGKEASTKIN